MLILIATQSDAHHFERDIILIFLFMHRLYLMMGKAKHLVSIDTLRIKFIRHDMQHIKLPRFWSSWALRLKRLLICKLPWIAIKMSDKIRGQRKDGVWWCAPVTLRHPAINLQHGRFSLFCPTRRKCSKLSSVKQLWHGSYSSEMRKSSRKSPIAIFTNKNIRSRGWDSIKGSRRCSRFRIYCS